MPDEEEVGHSGEFTMGRGNGNSEVAIADWHLA
jgi:hypothetical protein